MTPHNSTRETLSRRAFNMAGLGVAATSLAACGGKEPGSTSNGDRTTLWALTGGPEDLIRALIEEWNSTNPGKEIEPQFFANDAYKEKIRSAIGTGNQPTLIWTWGNGGTVRAYAKENKIADLTGKVDDAEKRAIPSILEAGQIDGKQYALPNNNAQPVLLYLNKELFEKHGVTTPTTWDELLTAVEKFKAAEIIPIAVAGASKWPYLMWIQYLTDRIGGPEPFTSVLEGKKDSWRDPAFKTACERIQELVTAGGFGDRYGSVVADANADVALLYTHKAAMLVQGPWIYEVLLKNAPDLVSKGGIGVTQFPEIPNGKGGISNITGNPANYWAVSADASTTSQEIAIEFLNKMNLGDLAIDEMLNMGLVPAAMGVEDRIAKANNSEYLTYVYDVVKNAQHFQMSWDQALDADPAQTLLTNLSQIFLKEITPEQFVENMNGTL